MSISKLIRDILPARLAASGKIANRRPPERGSGCIDSETFFYKTGCIRHGCGCTEFLGGPEGGMSQNICCAKCGAEYNNTPFGIHSLDEPNLAEYVQRQERLLSNREAGGLSVSAPPPPPTSEKQAPSKPDLTTNPLLEDAPEVEPPNALLL